VGPTEGEQQILGTIATAEDRRDHSYSLDLQKLGFYPLSHFFLCVIQLQERSSRSTEGENLVVSEDNLTVEYVVEDSFFSPSKPSISLFTLARLSPSSPSSHDIP